MTAGMDAARRDAPLRSFGRSKGRPLSARQQHLIDTLLPRLALPARPVAPFDPRQLWPAARAVWFEVGFGGGEHLIGQARAHVDVLHLGAEPFQDGIAKALTAIDAEGLSNVRLLADDARPLLSALTPGSLERISVLFPDPWHKARHAKRRLVQASFLDDAARALAPGGLFRFATDWAAYAGWTLERLCEHPAFEWTAETARDWREPPGDHITTRYETKGLGDCAPLFLNARRL